MQILHAEQSIYLFLGALAAWSLVWVFIASYFLLRKDKHPIKWITHIAWACINISIVVIGALSVAGATVIDSDFVTLQRNIVAINIALDIIYLFVASRLLISGKPSYKQVGSAVQIQAAFLLVFDAIFAVVLTILL